MKIPKIFELPPPGKSTVICEKLLLKSIEIKTKCSPLPILKLQGVRNPSRPSTCHELRGHALQSPGPPSSMEGPMICFTLTIRNKCSSRVLRFKCPGFVFLCKSRFLGGKKNIRVKFQCAEPCFGAMIKGNTIDEGQSEIPSLKLT